MGRGAVRIPLLSPLVENKNLNEIIIPLRVPYEDYLRIKVVTLGTSVSIPAMLGGKGYMIVPFDSSKTIGDVLIKIKSTIPTSSHEAPPP